MPLVCLSSVRVFVCQTGDPRPNGSTYRNAFCSVRQMRALSAVAELLVLLKLSLCCVLLRTYVIKMYRCRKVVAKMLP